jgi:photosystem II stability/assembly factor-like uncharacterized protein
MMWAMVRFRFPLVLVVGLVLGASCSSGGGGKNAGTVGTTTSTAPATTSSTSAPSGCPKVRPATEFPAPSNLADLQMVGPQKGFAVGKGTILVTDDGATWTPRYSGGAAFSAVNAVDATHAWAVGDRSLYGTTDGGKTWKGRGNPDDGTVLRQVHFIDEHFGWGVGRGKLYRSGDGGSTWGELLPPCGAEAVCFTAQDDGWVAVGNRVYRSTSGGDSWTPVFAVPGTASTADWHPMALQCTRGGAVWALFSRGDAAAGHVPYAVYRGTAAGEWRLVAKESMTAPDLPDAPSLGGYPAPISVLDADSAALLTFTGPADPPVGLRVATGGGGSLGPERKIPALSAPLAASFVSPDAGAGWVVGTKAGNGSVDLILATSDAGQTWQEQFARPAPK